jgi:NAD(P)-dependent dehydrogenase (short-subunit alcohol dehydrogenase family)
VVPSTSASCDGDHVVDAEEGGHIASRGTGPKCQEPVGASHLTPEVNDLTLARRFEMEVANGVAIITGAGADGTGRATALALAERGASVVVSDVDPEGGRETVGRIQERGGQAAFVRADVRVRDDLHAMVRFAEDSFGGVDVLVNNAGNTWRPHFPDCSAEHWEATLALNLLGPMIAIQLGVAAMRRRGEGAIVNVSSVAGLGYGVHDSPEYAAAKAGLIRLTATLAPLAERNGVRV